MLLVGLNLSGAYLVGGGLLGAGLTVALVPVLRSLASPGQRRSGRR